jgi:hypothetical protein
MQNPTPDVFLIIFDSNSNILFVRDNQNYSLIYSKVQTSDYPISNSTDDAAQNAIVRVMKNNYNYNLDKSRLYDISLVDPEGIKKYVFLYKITPYERNILSVYPFFSINEIPILNRLSSPIILSITSNFDIIRNTPNPRGILTINYPNVITVYRPVEVVPMLIPYVKFIPKVQPQSNEPLFHEKPKPIEIKVVKQPIRLSEKVFRTSEKSKSSKKSSKKKSSKNNENDNDTETKTKGGYYKKYLKYKLKYFEVKKELLELKNKLQ